MTRFHWQPRIGGWRTVPAVELYDGGRLTVDLLRDQQTDLVTCSVIVEGKEIARTTLAYKQGAFRFDKSERHAWRMAKRRAADVALRALLTHGTEHG